MTLAPDVQSIKAAYKLLFDNGHSLSKIRDAALSGRLFRSTNGALGVVGRSLAWKLYLIPNEPLQSASDSSTTPPLATLQSLRQKYAQLLLEKLRAPDGSYADGVSVPGSPTFSKRAGETPENLETNNPLSLHNENPWTTWFASLELRKTIQQDVERTFPDIGYFRDSDVQLQLANVLFLYSLTHPSIGYRQGMHELLAPLYYAIHWDSIPDDASLQPEEAATREFCSRNWVAADAWVLFEAVMRGVAQWYEWRDTPSDTSSAIVSPLAGHVQLNLPNGRLGTQPYVTPIVQACNRIQSILLKSVDPTLWKALHSTGIEPQIYGIRWLRLLFTREFPLDEAMIIWDGLFACDPTFELAQWLCVTMLLRIRNKLIPSDYSTQLMFLLRYPAPPRLEAPKMNAPAHHATILLQQALTLQMSPTSSTGASIMVENRNLLHIPVEVPEHPSSLPSTRAGNNTRDKASSESRSSNSGRGRPEPNRHGMHPGSTGLPEMIAKGLMDRGESLGINKTLMSAVSELKRNLPELAASLVRTPATGSASYSAFPLIDERPSAEQPPWEPRTRFEIEKEISALRLRDKRLGGSLTWIVDTLLQDEEGRSETGHVERIKATKREALECLAYVRDALNGANIELDEERLFGEQEFRRKRNMTRKAKEGSQGLSSGRKDIDLPAPAVPVSISTSASRARHARPDSIHNPFAHRPNANARSRSPPISAASTSPPLSSPLSTSSHPPRQFRAPSSTSLPAPSASLSPSSDSTRLPPWSYTRSNFVTPSSQVTASLPRPPPPTSSVLYPSRATSAAHTPDPADVGDPGRGAGGIPTRTSTASRDPLGALS